LRCDESRQTTRQRQWKTAAQARLRELVSQLDRKEFVEPSKLTLGQYLKDEWLPRVNVNKGPRTYEIYRNIVENHIHNPAIGNIPLQQLTPSDIERYHASKAGDPKEPLSKATLTIHHAVLTSALKIAKRDKRVRDNVAVDADRPNKAREQKAKPKTWDVEETRKILAAARAAGTQTSAFLSLALDSGARKGELQGLRWTDLDLTRGTMKIERQLLTPGEAPVFGPAKTRQERLLSLSEKTVAVLKEHKREQAELKLANRLHYSDHGLVFAQTFEHEGKLGTPLTVATIAWTLEKLIRSTKVRRISVHGLRHTSATLALASGVPSKVVQQRLRHSTIGTTLDLYAHPLESQHQDAASRIGATLYG
jgi:integrase